MLVPMKQTEPKNKGRPAKKADELAKAKRPGMRRFTCEMTEDMLARVDAQAMANQRPRNAEIRVLVDEALEGRAKKSRRGVGDA